MQVTTQKELDAALAASESLIVINSPRGVWLRIGDSDSATVRAYDSATVEASGSATVQAYGRATVQAYGSATVHASGSATVEAYGSATVQAYDSATVEAYDSATVQAYGRATVQAYGSATVRAYGRATVRAGKCVAVRLHSKTVALDGGVVIDLTDLDLNDTTTWLDYHGVTVTDGRATVYKAVDADLNAGHRHELTAYPIGAAVADAGWRPAAACGNGLHFGYTPATARAYYTGEGPARYLECTVAVDTLVALRDKCKAPECVVVREVDTLGRPVASEAVKA